MKWRMATIYFVMMFLNAVASSSAQGQTKTTSPPTLKGITAVSVLVESLSTGAKGLGLSEEAIQTDVELKLRLAGIRVVTQGQIITLPGMPSVYVRATVAPGEAAFVEVELDQDVRLERNGQFVVGIGTWRKGTLLLNPSVQHIRDVIKDLIDEFLNDWLSVNPKK